MAIEARWLQEVERLLAGRGWSDPAQLRLMDEWRRHINRKIPKDAELWSACDHAQQCWAKDHGPRPTSMRARLPWIGPQYTARRIAVVAINSRDDGQPDAEVRATLGMIESLQNGHRGYGPTGRSYFHYRIASAVHAVVQAQDNQRIEASPLPADTVQSLLGCARLQAIQCSPCSTARRSPTAAMIRTCPRFLLREQIELLAPDVLMLFGRPAHRALEEPPLDMTWSMTWQQSGRCFSRGQTGLRDRPLEVLAFVHPSTASWSKSWTKFLKSIGAQPLARTI